MKKTIISTLAFIILCLLIEVFVFNYKHWVSLRAEEVPSEQIVLGDAYQDNKDGTYTIMDEGDASISVSGLNRELITSYISMNKLNRDADEPKKVQIWQAVTDESSSLEYELPVKEIWEDEPRSKYTVYHLYGKCNSIRFFPDLSGGSVVSIDICINPVIPLQLSWLRVVFLFGLLSMGALFWPGSFLYRIKYADIKKGLQWSVIGGLFVVHVGLFWLVSDMNPAFTWGIPEHHKQYQKLAEAFKEGSMSLLETPAASLQALSNPYDSALREETVEAHGETFAWDTAYYNGKYYVYFGVVPVLLFYLPYYLITGTHIANYTVVFLLSVFYVLGLLWVLKEAVKMWFPGLSLGIWILTVELTLLGSGVVYLVKRPDFYNIPILAGLTLGIWGLGCFIKACQDEISLKWLGVGTLLTALVAGCRPQLMMFALFPVVLFSKQLLSKEFYRSKAGKMALLTVLLPLVVVGGGLMYYNYVRFGSGFDFGANYNLTTNDMRFRGWVWGRIPLGLFVYLFQPMKIVTEFPFVQTLYVQSRYMGLTIQEYTAGGIFATHFWAWFAVGSIFIRKRVQKEYIMPWILSVCGLVSAVIIAVADTEMAGVLWRYQADFSLFIMLAAVMTCWIAACHSKVQSSSLSRYLVGVILLCMVTEIGFQVGTFFLDGGSSLQEMRPDLFVKAKYLIGFWM